MSRGRGAADRLPSSNPSPSPRMGLYTPSLLSPRPTHIACKGMPKKERRMEGKTAHPSIAGGGGGTVKVKGGKRDASEEPAAPSPVRRTSEEVQEALVKKILIFYHLRCARWREWSGQCN